MTRLELYLTKPGRIISQAQACSGLRIFWSSPGENEFGTTDLGRMLQITCQLHHLLHACILSELLERAKQRGDHEQADQIKRISPVSWKHVNFYGQYDFLNAASNIDLSAIVDSLEEINGGKKAPN